ncbi:MAG TPA: hypothetical protein VFW63_09680 [Acidimicrobiales bacterium]|nr:hypothetical protein [Acidimicrobiales bacterium]
MTRRPPAHAHPGGPDAAEPDADAGPSGAGSPLGAALRGLAPPRHGPDFWPELDARLADEPQLRLAPRSAIRPITQPPPVIDDRNLLEGLRAGEVPRPPRPSSRGRVVGIVAAVLTLLLVLAAVQSPDEDPADGRGSAPPEADEARTPTTGAPPPSTTAPPPTTAPGTIDPGAELTPHGVGPLRIGATLADLQAAGMNIQPDRAELEASGGTCFVARVAGALDLELRFRAPDDRGVDDPSQGVLSTVSIESGLPTNRASDSAIRLGAPQDQVLAAYAGNLDDRPHPMVSNGHIYRADAGDGTGIAFQTDGMTVIGITVGEHDAVRYVDRCA